MGETGKITIQINIKPGFYFDKKGWHLFGKMPSFVSPRWREIQKKKEIHYNKTRFVTSEPVLFFRKFQ